MTESQDVHYNPFDWSREPLTFSITSGGDLFWKGNNTIQYSKNGGEWTNWVATSTGSGTSLTVAAGDVIQLKGNNSYYGDSKFGSDSSAKFNAKGNIMSLINSTGYTGETSVVDEVFYGLFGGCVGLVSCEDLTLPATILGMDCYVYMFRGCTSLTTAPALPATTLKTSCYSYMFSGCTSLTTAPELPATALTNYCYDTMFQGCSSLTTAPVLSATTLEFQCYVGMFSGCTSLNYIKCLATDISINRCTENWVSGVAATGTFVKNASMSSWTTGSSGIPTNWTVQDAS